MNMDIFKANGVKSLENYTCWNPIELFDEQYVGVLSITI